MFWPRELSTIAIPRGPAIRMSGLQEAIAGATSAGWAVWRKSFRTRGASKDTSRRNHAQATAAVAWTTEPVCHSTAHNPARPPTPFSNKENAIECIFRSEEHTSELQSLRHL